MRVLTSALVVLLAIGCAFAGDVEIVMKWPEHLVLDQTTKIKRSESERDPASVAVNVDERTVQLVNIPADWSVEQKKDPIIETPQIQFIHSGRENVEIIVTSYFSGIETPDVIVTLQKPGEKYQSPVGDLWFAIEVIEP